jgi:hypothetical protein
MRPYFWLPWDKPFPPLTDEVIHEVEDKLGVKLPESYLEVMRARNGGLLRFARYLAPTGYDWKCIGVEKFEAISFDTIFKSTWNSKILSEIWGIPLKLVVLSSDGHRHVALDYRSSPPDSAPSVIFLDDVEPDKVFWLAPNFETFVDSLLDGIWSHVIGFVGVGEEIDPLKDRINRLLEVDLRRRVLPNQSVVYEDQKEEWESTLESYAELSLQKNTPSYYPWFPQCDWLFFYDVKDYPIAEDVWQKVSQNCGYEAIKVHTPVCIEDY